MSNAVRIRNTGLCDQNDRRRLHLETLENVFMIRLRSLPHPLSAAFLFLCIRVAGIFVKVRLHVNTAVRVTCDVFSEVIVVARQDGI